MPGGWKNSLCERWVRRPTLGLSNFAQNATVKAIIEDRLFTTATARPAPAGDRLYFHNQALQFDSPWVKTPQLGHYFPGDIALNSDGTILLAEVTQDTSASNRYLPQIIKVDSGGTVQAAAFMTDSLGSAFSIYTTDIRVASGAAGYVFCASSSDQSVTPRVPTLYILSANLTTLLWSASSLGGTTDRVFDIRAAADGNSAYFCVSYYYTNRSTAICFRLDSTGAPIRRWDVDQVSASKDCFLFNSAEDASGNLYLFGVTSGGTVEGSLIFKFNTSNTVAWQLCLGGNPYSKSLGFVVSTGNLYHAQSDWLDGIMLSKVTSAGAVSSQTRLYLTGVTLILMAFIGDGADGAYLLLRAIDTVDYVVLMRLDSSFSILWQIKLTPVSMGTFQTYSSGGLDLDSNYVYASIPQMKFHMRVSKDGMSPTVLDAGGGSEATIAASSLLTQSGSTTITTTSIYTNSSTSLTLPAAPSGFAVRSSGFTPDLADVSGLTVTGEPRVSQVEGARFPGGFTVASNGIYAMDRSPGSSQVGRPFSSIASATARQGVLFGVYVSDPINNPQWIGDGDATLFIADAISNTALDFTAGSPEVYVWRPSTYQRVGTLYNAAGARMGTAATTANNEKVTAARFRPCPIYALSGDVIVVELWGQVLSTGQPSYTGTAYFDGATINDTDNASVSNYAANIRFSETLTFNIVSQTFEVAHAATANATASQDGNIEASITHVEAGSATESPDGTRTMISEISVSVAADAVPSASATFSPAQNEIATATAEITGGASIDSAKEEPTGATTEQDISTGKFAIHDALTPALSDCDAQAVFVAEGTGLASGTTEQAGTTAMPVSVTSNASPNTAQDVSAAFGPAITEQATGSDAHDSEFKLGGVASESAPASATQNGIGAMGVNAVDGSGDPNFGSVMLLMHMEGEDDGVETHEQNGHDVSFVAHAVMTAAQKKFGTSSAYFPSIGGALSLAKDGQFVFHGDFTFEGWARLELSSTNQGIALFANNVTIKASGVFAGYFTANFDGSQTNHQTSMTINNWFHWAVVRKDGEIVIYLNGVKSNMTPINYTDTVEALPGGLILGSYGQFGEGPLEGWLDEVRFSRFARYTNTFSLPTAPFSDYAYTGAMASELSTFGPAVPADIAEETTATEISNISKIRYAVSILESLPATSSTDADQITGDLIADQLENCFALATITGTSAAAIEAYVTASTSASDLQRAGYSVQAIVQAFPADEATGQVATGAGVTEQVISLEASGTTIQFVVESQGQATAEDSVAASANRIAAVNETVKALSILVGQILGYSGLEERQIFALQQTATLFVMAETAQITVMVRNEESVVKE